MMSEAREKLGTRLGFLLISAGCAIGLGNVWRFPFMTGQYGGAAFVLIYLVFLFILGLPVLTMELAIGRGRTEKYRRSPDGTGNQREASGISTGTSPLSATWF